MPMTPEQWAQFQAGFNRRIGSPPVSPTPTPSPTPLPDKEQLGTTIGYPGTAENDPVVQARQAALRKLMGLE